MDNNLFIVFNYVCTYVLTCFNVSKYDSSSFHLPYFHVENSTLFIVKYSGTLLLHRRSLDACYFAQSLAIWLVATCFIAHADYILGICITALSNTAVIVHTYPDSMVHVANMGPTWGRRDPGGPHVGPLTFVIWVVNNVIDRRTVSWLFCMIYLYYRVQPICFGSHTAFPWVHVCHILVTSMFTKHLSYHLIQLNPLLS